MTVTAPARTEVADVLDKAAQHIDTHGWTQGHFFSDTDPDLPVEKRPADIYGALKIPAGTEGYGGKLGQVMLVDAAITAFETHVGATYFGYNDADQRTAEQVTEALRATATSLQEATA